MSLSKWSVLPKCVWLNACVQALCSQPTHSFSAMWGQDPDIASAFNGQGLQVLTKAPVIARRELIMLFTTERHFFHFGSPRTVTLWWPWPSPWEYATFSTEVYLGSGSPWTGKAWLETWGNGSKAFAGLIASYDPISLAWFHCPGIHNLSKHYPPKRPGIQRREMVWDPLILTLRIF